MSETTEEKPLTIEEIVEEAKSLGDAASVIPVGERTPGGCSWGKDKYKNDFQKECEKEDMVIVGGRNLCLEHGWTLVNLMQIAAALSL